MIADQPPLPVEQAVIAYYEQAAPQRMTSIIFRDGARYELKLAPNKFEKGRMVCVILDNKKLAAIVWATNGDDHFTMSPSPKGNTIKNGEYADFVFDACAHLITTDRERREKAK